MSTTFIPQIEPWLGPEEKQALIDVIEDNWITEGKRTEAFQKKVGILMGARYVQAVNNGTVSLFISMKSLGLKPGDEVIVPDITFVATSNAVIFAGGTPIFADIDRQTFQLDVSNLDRYLTKKTVGIVPVHLYGGCVDMQPLLEWAKNNGLWVLEDAAQAIGVKYMGKPVGALGDAGILSFYGNKQITTGEGGCILTNRKDIYTKAHSISHEGRKKGDFTAYEVGLNFCFTDLQAALGLCQLKKLKAVIKKKNQIFDTYKQNLTDISQLTFVEIPSYCQPTHWFSNIFVPDVPKLADFLAQHHIGSRRIFPPLHTQPCYLRSPFTRGDYPNATWAYEHGLSLPSSATLTDQDQDRVIQTIHSFYKKYV